MWFDKNIVEAFWNEDNAGAYNKKPGWKILARAASLCNNAEFKEGQDDKSIITREVTGNETDAAILKCTEIFMGKVMDYRARNKRVFELPFHPTNRFEVTIHETEDPEDNSYILVMKGAPERILERCSTIVINGVEEPLTKDWMKYCEETINLLGGTWEEPRGIGERVIGFCDLMLPANKYPEGYPFDIEEENFPLCGLRFIGLMSMIEPIKEAAPDAIAEIKRSGIKVIMVTEDHPWTAKAIAGSVGIIPEGMDTLEDITARNDTTIEEVDSSLAQAAVVTGQELKDFSETQLCEILKKFQEIVFTRTSPSQKLLIVEACQNLGAIVAVTGNSINDIPALKRAELGIAMGSGSDAAKQAADMILTDDSFASIVKGIKIGGDAFEKLKKIPFWPNNVRNSVANPWS